MSTLPVLGEGVLYATLLVAAYTFAVAVAAARGRPRWLESARLGGYAVSGLVSVGVLLLAYGFVSHDFRLTYVAAHSDRATPWYYLLSALWGGQDGSLLWWLFLLSLYSGACLRWLKGRFRQIQPVIIATLMVVIAFFVVMMLFSANPFETTIGRTPANGQALNPLLQNFYMIIHPPALYLGFVGCTIPFAFAIGAMVKGRLDSEWVVGARKWMLFAWLFLTLGNALGMLWSYEELREAIGPGILWKTRPVSPGLRRVPTCIRR